MHISCWLQFWLKKNKSGNSKKKKTRKPNEKKERQTKA